MPETVDRPPGGIRPNLTDPAVLDALAHPVRLDVLGYLMSSGPATASQCARAVGDTPSNCSYHLRVLASHGLVATAPSTDGRTRPWRATITGFTNEPEPRVTTSGEDCGDERSDGTADTDALMRASLDLDHHLAREHLRTRHELDPEWRAAADHASYGLRVSPGELKQILSGIDAVLRPYIAATRGSAPDDAAYAQVTVTAFPRPTFDGR